MCSKRISAGADSIQLNALWTEIISTFREEEPTAASPSLGLISKSEVSSGDDISYPPSSQMTEDSTPFTTCTLQLKVLEDRF